MAVKLIPDGYHAVTPYLAIKGAAQLIDFLKATFDAKEVEIMKRPDGSIHHAEVKIGDSIIMIGERGDSGPSTPGMLYIYVADCDATYKRALAAGATSLMAPADQFYGDRNAGVRDATGSSWWISQHLEDVSPEEMKRRAAESYVKQK